MDIKTIKQLISKMISDKKKVNEYIKLHGSLKGFDDKSINFSHPL